MNTEEIKKLRQQFETDPTTQGAEALANSLTSFYKNAVDTQDYNAFRATVSDPIFQGGLDALSTSHFAQQVPDVYKMGLSMREKIENGISSIRSSHRASNPAPASGRGFGQNISPEQAFALRNPERANQVSTPLSPNAPANPGIDTALYNRLVASGAFDGAKPLGATASPQPTASPVSTPNAVPMDTNFYNKLAGSGAFPGASPTTPVAAPQNTGTTPQTTTSVRINPGENLAQIAAKYGTTVQAILQANANNPGAIPNPSNPNLIIAGGVLNLPAANVPGKPTTGASGQQTGQGSAGTGAAANATPTGGAVQATTGMGAMDYLSSITTLLNNSLGVDEIKENIAGARTEINDFFSKRKSAEQILQEEFERRGIEEKQSLLNDLDTQIREQTKRLRDLPENLKTTLQDVGVTQAQLDRLVVAESKKPTEILRDLMTERNALDTQISKAMSFAEKFTDTILEDQATQLAGLEFQLDQGEDDFKDLTEEKKNLISLAINEKKDIMELAMEAAKAGATQKEVDAIIGSKSAREAVQYASPSLARKSNGIEYKTYTFDGNVYQYPTDSTGKVVGPLTKVGSSNVPAKAIPSFNDYLSTAEKEAGMNFSPKVRDELRVQYDKNLANQPGDTSDYTDTQKLKLEQAGLLNAPRQKQLDALFKSEGTTDWANLLQGTAI